MIKKVGKILLIILGFVFIVFGAISLLLPFSPGFLFLFLGITLAAKGSGRIRNSKSTSLLFGFVNSKINILKEKINWNKLDRLL
ncbi:hypothetical protein A2331_04425 [Candidatus Falkowbacteria bacterium RIFOXYB2_FULL_34_18]|uniref:DUF454 domain-containing protein n=1 Tax=Candidatus Falkowbacteria bacterium RIFOXYD2_FULL_34_120 TaxID=1798007 RepID=A0A1F5TMG7_9BACT|nr:MAG: hypothetical protein A2331_04425 [Candidatus Falkowbacteria bacterium RIFOXYB2_FULL_34_18]OGF30281.1 MAG: hypothetical protein A2500_06805 [Candidatus Falkowbacteria bacterium RIFOXYC12_FULL_34_55]OGF37832.1 MAG: hypothetical protein A2466_03930 [Candidatus Falkowbacteria bacterium RIFOXYC2_FULL_34_220]OGF39593.1 MAG: hypothetical protein A2515_03645 [Candidatus Falkowbacteria bacterium RIFOXYD12_FULL_34_57]OGF40017.1 MAG: hypothetical protein A2531_07375 [Candidatus Falkowbacteria bact